MLHVSTTAAKYDIEVTRLGAERAARDAFKPWPDPLLTFLACLWNNPA